MMELIRKENKTYLILTMAVAAAAVFFICRIVYAGVLGLPYSRELLEPSNVALTNLFLEGKSPYTVSSLSWDVPGINYDYPFLNSLIAAGIAKITGCNTVTAHFALSLFCILASAVIGFEMVAKFAKTTVAPTLAALLFMFCHFRFGYISAAPDDLGLLFLLITSLLAVSEKVKNKPLWCAVGIALCFYTKQYFVLVAAGIFIYMFLYSKKDALLFLLWSIVINGWIAVMITLFWPLYWTRVFLFIYLGTVDGGGGKLATLLGQLEYLAVLFAALFLIIIVAVAMAIRKLYKSGRNILKIKVGENDAFVMSAVQSVIMLAPLFVMGKNDGAFISYFLQLWMPFISVVALISFERMAIGDKNSGDEDLSKNKIRNLVVFALYTMITVFTVYFGFGKLPLHVITSEEIAAWEKAYSYTRRYSEEGEIYYSRGLAYDGFKRGNGDWQCGHEGEVDCTTVGDLTDAGIPLEYFPYVQPIVDQNEKYRNGLLKKALDHKYSLITFEEGDEFIVFNEDVCEKAGYKCIDRFDLQFGNMPYEVVFYALAE